MWKTRVVALGSLLIAVAATTASADYTVSETGFGPMRFGMTIRQAEKVLGVKLQQDGYTDYDSCRYFFPVGKFPDVAFMTANGRIVRVDVDVLDAKKPASTTTTDRGAKIGDSEARMLELYAERIKVGPHFYTGPKGHYLRVINARGKVRMIFETDGKTVERFRAGGEPAVEYVEGCE